MADQPVHGADDQQETAGENEEHAEDGAQVEEATAEAPSAAQRFAQHLAEALARAIHNETDEDEADEADEADETGDQVGEPFAAALAAALGGGGGGNTGMTFSPSTPLHRAATEGRVDVLLRLLQIEGFSPNSRQLMDTRTPLHSAARADHVYCAFALLKAKATIDARGNDGSTPLMDATRAGACKSVGFLLKHKADVHSTQRANITPVHMAALHGHTATLRLLLAAKGDPGAPVSDTGFRPLHMAAGEDSVDCMALLVQQKADVDARALDGRRPLHHAAAQGYVRSGKELQRLGAALSAVDDAGSTALHVSGRYSSTAFARWLLKTGACPVGAVTVGGRTCLHDAATTGSQWCVKAILQRAAEDRRDRMRLLLQVHRRQPRLCCYDIWLRICSMVAVPELVDQPDAAGNTALHCALSSCSSECIRHLLQANADPYRLTANGQSPADCLQTFVDYDGPVELPRASSKDVGLVTEYLRTAQRHKRQLTAQPLAMLQPWRLAAPPRPPHI
jgi:ankyrin repeat protein